MDIAARHGSNHYWCCSIRAGTRCRAAVRSGRPVRGVHNSGWVQSPGAERLDDRRYRQVLQEYVVRILTQFRNDERVLAWDLWNEPDNPAAVYKNGGTRGQA